LEIDKGSRYDEAIEKKTKVAVCEGVGGQFSTKKVPPDKREGEKEEIRT